MATPTKAQAVALNRTIHTAKLVAQQYGQSERQLSDMTLADQKAPLTALKTALDSILTTIG